jgi:hypothetical protein
MIRKSFTYQLFIFLATWGLSFNLLAQTYEYRLILVDFETRDPLENVRVACDDISKVLFTPKSGEIEWDDAALDSLNFSFRLIGYEPLDLTVFSQRDSLQIVFMLPAQTVLPTVEISILPKVVYSNDTMNVADYAFTKQGMLLLTYTQERRWKRAEEAKVTLYMGCQLVLLDQDNHVVQAVSLDEDCKHFYKDCPGEIFLYTRHDMYWINLQSNGISYSRVEQEDFSKSIEPIVDTIDHLVYYSNYNKEFPAFDYYQYNSADSSFELVQHIEDEAMMRMLRSEYKYLTPREKLDAYRFEMETGMDKEVVAAYMRGFQNTHYYEPLNAPLFAQKDGVCIFDHHHHEVSQFDLDNKTGAKYEIKHHLVKRPKWLEKIWHDKSNEAFYTAYYRNGFTELHRITPGLEIKKCMDLTYQFVDFIAVRDNFVYYIYRPFESSQNRYLYKERIQSGMH